ncbi:LysR family transcriptional regulator [uncultured Limosilactobacillus sp.]|uniref:LysR family transcriptional regulator n=1 Tax=uncultured Limosilactobacillus sp. TaxID=2837629 RepID=UPI0025EDCC77|nr:LysR family transcriptional regulator [uncultured Limosilactobacillus sp.]
METRVLRYFLTVAQTNNITKAAAILHVTQPTLSRQMMELEAELGVKLFLRRPRHLELTPEGALFQQRAAAILQLWEHSKEEVQTHDKGLSGTVHVGCVESSVSPFLMKVINHFLEQYPQVKLTMFDGDGDTLRENLDRGLLDVAALIEPVEATKYNYLVLPVKEEWGVIMRADDPLANRQWLNRHDIYQLPLVVSRRGIVRDEISDVLRLDQAKLHIRMTINLPGNAMQLIKGGNYYALAIKGVYDNAHDADLAFVPIRPRKSTGHVMVWQKNRQLTDTTTAFIQKVAAAINQHSAK